MTPPIERLRDLGGVDVDDPGELREHVVAYLAERQVGGRPWVDAYADTVLRRIETLLTDDGTPMDFAVIEGQVMAEVRERIA